MVCCELANKMGASGGYLLGLQEVVCDGAMIRPIHHSECLLDIVLLWAYWDVKYRKDNYIVCLQPNSLLIEIMPFVSNKVYTTFVCNVYLYSVLWHYAFNHKMLILCIFIG